MRKRNNICVIDTVKETVQVYKDIKSFEEKWEGFEFVDGKNGRYWFSFVRYKFEIIKEEIDED